MVARRKRFALLWRRSGAGLRLVLFLLAMALFGLLVYSQRPNEDSGELVGSVLFIVLLNLLIVLSAVLLFLIGRNLTKLIFDRRRKLLGSKLRLRLVGAFVALTMIPGVMVFVMASGLINRAMDDWFGRRVSETIDGAISLARQHYQLMTKDSLRLAHVVRAGIETRPELLESSADFERYLEGQRTRLDLFSIKVMTAPDQLIAEAVNAANVLSEFKEPPTAPDRVAQALEGERFSQLEEYGASQFIRVYEPVKVLNRKVALVCTLRIDPDLSNAFGSVLDSHEQYSKLTFHQQPLRYSYLLTLAIVTGMLLFSAIWIGFYMAKNITVPIQRIAEGMSALAQGNYDLQIKVSGDDEMSYLARSFNRMISDLNQTRRESERRRLAIETMLSNLAVGVIGIDNQGQIAFINPVAQRLFDLSEDLVGKTLPDVLSPKDSSLLADLLKAALDPSIIPRRDHELSVDVQGLEVKLICNVGRIIGEFQEQLGTILLFEDISVLAKAQQMAAWREVARRIAHEIKNPLTPIQLAAQRLARNVTSSEDLLLVKECTDTIVEHVSSIKRLADEFSQFARMPQAEFKPTNLNQLVLDVLAPFAERERGISFQSITDRNMPLLAGDAEQLRRMMMNLLTNSIDALREHGSAASASLDSGVNRDARIMIRTRYDAARLRAILELSDNGPGISTHNKTHIFEPYFTTKAQGSGLGLAIVSAIVADHRGQIRVLDNEPYGAKFVVELPVEQSGSASI